VKADRETELRAKRSQGLAEVFELVDELRAGAAKSNDRALEDLRAEIAALQAKIAALTPAAPRREF